jgi:hypothetical protein
LKKGRILKDIGRLDLPSGVLMTLKLAGPQSFRGRWQDGRSTTFRHRVNQTKVAVGCSCDNRDSLSIFAGVSAFDQNQPQAKQACDGCLPGLGHRQFGRRPKRSLELEFSGMDSEALGS